NGRVLDEDARSVPGTLVELWQCNAARRYRHPVDQHDAPLHPNFDGGRYAHPDDTGVEPLDPNFRGFGRVATAADARFCLTSNRPGPVPRPGQRGAGATHPVAPFARGLLKQLFPRIFFAGEALNQTDPVLASIADPARRQTLIAARRTRVVRRSTVSTSCCTA